MKPILTIGSTEIWTEPGQSAFMFKSGMAIDADGAPRAYHPQSAYGLDNLGNAGKPGNWWALVTDDDTPQGKPVIQGADDPAPGFYVSATSLADPSRPRIDPRRYVDSSTIPYIALPKQVLQVFGARRGDYALVRNLRTGSTSAAVFADGGPAGKIGEGSIALADHLSLPSSPRHGGTERRSLVWLVFANSRDQWPRTVEEIDARVDALFADWGGEARLGEWIAVVTGDVTSFAGGAWLEAQPAPEARHALEADAAGDADIRRDAEERPSSEELRLVEEARDVE